MFFDSSGNLLVTEGGKRQKSEVYVPFGNARETLQTHIQDLFFQEKIDPVYTSNRQILYGISIETGRLL